MTMITHEELLRVASLSKLEIDANDLDHFAEGVNNIVDFVEQLQEVDTEGVEPTFHGNKLRDVYREDVAKLRGNTEELLANTPEREGNYIKVPEMIESEEA